jgi:hypothetical protein
MTTSVFHPAMIQLLWLQSRGRGRRMWAGFCQPRRLVLSAIACVLAVVWLGNAAMTIWLRETAEPETLRALLSIGLLLYAGWHFTKAAFFRPEGPFEWTPHECELLLTMPLRPRDLVAYQLASVTVTTLLKGALFTLLLLPDLRCVPLGLAGVLMAMMVLELLRMAIQIATWGMARSAYLAYRVVILTGLVVAGLAVGALIVRGDALGGRINDREGVLQNILEIVVQLHGSELGYVALPFRLFTDVIMADALTAANVGLAAVALATVIWFAAAVIGLYAMTARRVIKRERINYRIGGSNAREHRAMASTELRQLRWIPRLGGAGALAWRQMTGARRHWGSLLTAMIAPAVLAGAPCFVMTDPRMALVATTATLAFYTFLLLPTALRFDFRRDLDRLATLKGLPITPAAATIGQTLAPVLIATLFQSGVLVFAITVLSLSPLYVLLAMLVLIPLNVLVFGLDNLIYLLYPYRIQQEGLEIFLRTMLTFTAKGLLFTLGLVAMSGWGLAAAALTRGIASSAGIGINSFIVFMAGMVAGPSLLAALVLYGLSRTYSNMDPIEGIPR